MKLPKYRAWDHDDKKMWKVVAMSESIYGDCEDSYIKVCEFDKSSMDKETDIRLSFNFDLMQFTGLYDKNGKEIYEGDIVEFNDFDSLRTGGYTSDNIVRGKVVFAYGGWLVESKVADYDLYSAIINDDEFEVIGNIFQDGDLLRDS